MAGDVKTRRLYKPGHFPKDKRERLEERETDWTVSCEDTKLSFCEMKPWDKLKLYRPVEDIRKGGG